MGMTKDQSAVMDAIVQSQKLQGWAHHLQIEKMQKFADYLLGIIPIIRFL